MFLWIPVKAEMGNRMETRGIRVETREIRVGILGMREMWEIRVEMGGNWVRMRGTRVGMQRIRVILCENLRVYCFG